MGIHISCVFAQPDDSVLRGRIGSTRPCAAHASDGGRIYDITTTLLLKHNLNSFAHYHGRTIEIDGHDLVPQLVTYFVNRSKLIHDACVIYYHIKLATLFDSEVDHTFCCFLGGDIADKGKNFACHILGFFC